MDSDDDDVEVTGQQGFDPLRHAPHSRNDCLTHRFGQGNDTAFCPHCYCFVCDIPAGGCAEWASHCQATPNAPRWVTLRAQEARRKQSADLANQRQGQRRRTAQADRREERQAFTHQHVQDPEQAEEEQEELFSVYTPRYFKHGAEHPDACVETTSLSFVEPPCPVLPAQDAAPAQLPHILATAVKRGTLSSLQLEAVMYADARHSINLPGGERAGFFLGDGPGVGKGRQMAALILENWLAGRKRHIWLSVSPDLYHDARRDLDDLLAAHAMDARDLPIYNVAKLSYRDIDSGPAAKKEGVLFATYASLVAHEGEKQAERDRKEAALERDEKAFASAGTKRTRKEQLVKWMRGGGGDGCVIFDESHKAKNLVGGRGGARGGDADDEGGGWGKSGTKTAQAVMSLQEQLPQARVVYCSATGASSVRNMAYMQRLGLWGAGTQFADFGQFDKAIERSGFGGMELVALDMKQRGCYLSRTLSYKDATFETVDIELNAADKKMYDDCVDFWQTMLECFRHAVEKIAEMPGWKAPPHAMSQFWGAHQRFFKQLCMAIKVGTVVKLTKQARAEGKCVVVGLQTTGEARLAEALADAGEDGLEDFRGLFAIVESLLDRQFPTVGEHDEEDEAPQLSGDKPKPSGSAAKRPKLSAAGGGSSSSSSSGAGSSSGGGSGGRAGADLFDDESSDDDFSGEAQAERAALADKQKQLRATSDAVLQLALDGLGVKKWKGGKEREARVCRLHDEYRALWKLGKTQLKRRLVVELGARPKALPTDKRALVDKLWRRSLRHQWRLLERADALPEGLQRMPAEAASDDDDDDDGGGGGGGGGGADAAGGSDGEGGGGEHRVGKNALQMLTTGRLNDIRDELKREAQSLRLPDNPLDELIHALGGADKVAELTGRKMRLVYDGNGRPQVVRRAKELDTTVANVNMEEKRAFMDGSKMVAIISEAASSGISLQADRRHPNHARRVHITLELAWSADEALQQLGRSHRANQVSAPEYKLLMTTLGGERRFGAALAKRLQQLGALTKGDRRAADASQLSQFDFQTKYGRKALGEMIDSIRTRQCNEVRTGPLIEAVLGKQVADEVEQTGDMSKWEEHCASVEDAFLRVGLDLSGSSDKLPNVKTFLNRMLGVDVDCQARCFAHFSKVFDELISRDKSEARYDDGVVDIRANAITLKQKVPFFTDPTTQSRAQLFTLELDRGLDWPKALAELQAANAREAAAGNTDTINGFYQSRYDGEMGRRHQHLIIRKQYQTGAALSNKFYEMYRVLRPNKGLVAFEQRGSKDGGGLEARQYDKYDLSSERGRKAAEAAWRALYRDAEQCIHARPCTIPRCKFGTRQQTEALFAGCILPLWNAITEITKTGRSKFLRVTRVRLSTGQRIVGVKVPFSALSSWRAQFEKLGVTIDRDAYEQIDLVEKAAAKQASERSSEEGGGGASASGSGASPGAGRDDDETREDRDPQHAPFAPSAGAKRAAGPSAADADAKAARRG